MNMITIFCQIQKKKLFLCASNTAKFLPFYASLLSLDLFLHGTYLWIFFREIFLLPV